MPLNENQKPFGVAVSLGGVRTDSAVAQRVFISLHSGPFPDFCLHSAEMRRGAASRVIRVVAIQRGDREALGFDCRSAGDRKLSCFSLMEILNNAGGEADTCAMSLVRRPQVDSTPEIAAPWAWLASLSPADENVTRDRIRRLTGVSKITSLISPLST